MPKYTLTYFNGRGRAEVSRLILAAAKVPYDDVRIEGDKWPQYKSKTPLGFLPVLKVDGKGELTQSMTVARFLAREHGLAGKDNFDQGKVDMLLSTFEDLLAAGAGAMFEKDAELKKQKLAKYESETVPNTLSNLEKLAGSSGFFVGNSLTAADLGLFNFADGKAGLLDSCPKLKKIFDQVKANRSVQEWVAKRPETSF